MRQQINLYQPIFTEARKPFSAGVAFICLALLLGAMGAISINSTIRLNKVAAEVAELRAQQLEQQGALAEGEHESVEVLEARVARLERRVQERSRALEILRSGAAGTTVGFAPRLEALARRHVEGLWIDTMHLSGTNGAMMLSGSTFDPDMVPAYLRSLAADEVFAGTRFDDFVISRPADRNGEAAELGDKPKTYGSKVVRFRAGSTSLTPSTSEEASS